MPLTDKAIKAFKPATKPYKKSDEKGLYLLIHPNGSKYWRFKYLINEKEKVLALGVYPEVSLTEARQKTIDARKLVSNNQDPNNERKLEKVKQSLSANSTFETIAREWHENKREQWTLKHAKKLLRRLEIDAFPQIGYRPINAITAPEVLLMLRSIENRNAVDLAKRVMQSTGQIFRYAVATGRAERDVTADLKGALKSRKKRNLSSLSDEELPVFLNALEHYDGNVQTKIGLQLLIMTFVRTIELRGAKWNEINFEEKIWKIPAERMKMREAHIVPLSFEAVALFKRLYSINSYSEYVLPNANNPKTFISENTFLYALYRLGYHSRATVHGFRATASTILNENGFNPDVIERQLAHAERNKVRASYNHAQYMPERRKMMEWWSRYIMDYRTRMEATKNNIAA